jgi:hypothetical protein
MISRGTHGWECVFLLLFVRLISPKKSANTTDMPTSNFYVTDSPFCTSWSISLWNNNSLFLQLSFNNLFIIWSFEIKIILTLGFSIHFLFHYLAFMVFVIDSLHLPPPYQNLFPKVHLQSILNILASMVLVSKL